MRHLFISLTTLLLFSLTACSIHKTKSIQGIAGLNNKVSKIRFDYIDHNQNHKISKKEFVAYEKEKKEFMENEHINALIKSCDKNGDNQISLDELPKQNSDIPIIYEDAEMKKRPCFMSEHHFRFQDTNKDNILTFDELRTKRPIPVPMPVVPLRDGKEAMKKYLSKKYKKCDINNDDKLSLKEATSDACHMPPSDFKEADTNKNGFLTLQEILEIATRKYDERPVPRPVPPRPVRIPPTAPLEIRLMLSMQKCDINKDMKISEAELTNDSCGFSKEDFIEADANNDGYFSHEDMKILNLLRNFKRLDTNQDSFLSFDEFKKNPRVYY